MGGLQVRGRPHRRNTGEMLGDPGAKFLKCAVRFFLAVVPARSVVDLDQIDPTDRRAFPIQNLIDQTRCWFVSVKPGQNGPGIQAEGQGLPGLFAAIFEQPRRHAAAGEPSPQRRAGGSTPHDDSIADRLEGNVRAWPEPCALTEILGDHHLPLSANSLSHTASVYLMRLSV